MSNEWNCPSHFINCFINQPQGGATAYTTNSCTGLHYTPQGRVRGKPKRDPWDIPPDVSNPIEVEIYELSLSKGQGKDHG